MGGVASPNPFYWSDAGYGVLRNTFQDGSYDFGATEASTTTTRHNENELDAYYFVADASKGASTAPVAQDLLQDYFQVTGNPVLLPEYAFYVGHLNAWNRDMWSAEAKGGYGKKQIKGSEPASDPERRRGPIREGRHRYRYAARHARRVAQRPRPHRA